MADFVQVRRLRFDNGLKMDCINCGPGSPVESIETGRDGQMVVNQLRCANCGQVWRLQDATKKAVDEALLSRDQLEKQRQAIDSKKGGM